jgi:hypothetical protein
MNDLSLTRLKTFFFIFRFRRRSFDRLSKSVRRKFSPNLRSSLRTKRGRVHRLLSGKTNSNFAAAARWRTGGGEDEIKMSLKYFGDNWNLLLSFFQELKNFYSNGNINLIEMTDKFFTTLYQKMFQVFIFDTFLAATKPDSRLLWLNFDDCSLL